MSFISQMGMGMGINFGNGQSGRRWELNFRHHGNELMGMLQAIPTHLCNVKTVVC